VVDATLLEFVVGGLAGSDDDGVVGLWHWVVEVICG
jgi:hypothetical protein